MTKLRQHYFIGDIHGCMATLEALEALIHEDAEQQGVEPFIVSVGDLIDRGPDSRAVVRHIRAGVAAGTHAAVAGNHDLLMLECLHGFGPWDAQREWPAHLYALDDHHRRQYRAARWLGMRDHRDYRRMLWLSQGGYQTLQSYGCDPHRPSTWDVDSDDLGFLLGLPTLWRSESFIVSHALALPEHLSVASAHWFGSEDGQADEGSGMELKLACFKLVWNRDLSEKAPDPQRLHISGHTDFNRVRRHRAQACVQIDTGCVYGRKLTAFCGETGDVLSVPLMDEVDC
jgi:hypothetical protein